MRRHARMKYFRRRVMVLALVFIGVWVGAKAPALAPPQKTPFDRLFIDGKETTTTTTTEVVIAPTFGGFCPDVVAAAYSLGWQKEHLGELDYVAWKESRCLPHVHFVGDPNGGSHGVMQINGFWCRPSRYSERGWLQDQQLVSSCDDLYNPIVSLLAAQAIYAYSALYNGNGWQPWGMPKDFCDSSTVAELCHVSWGGKGGG